MYLNIPQGDIATTGIDPIYELNAGYIQVIGSIYS